MSVKILLLNAEARGNNVKGSSKVCLGKTRHDLRKFDRTSKDDSAGSFLGQSGKPYSSDVIIGLTGLVKPRQPFRSGLGRRSVIFRRNAHAVNQGKRVSDGHRCG